MLTYFFTSHLVPEREAIVDMTKCDRKTKNGNAQRFGTEVSRYEVPYKNRTNSRQRLFL